MTERPSRIVHGSGEVVLNAKGARLVLAALELALRNAPARFRFAAVNVRLAGATVPSAGVALIEPPISASEALVIWMSRMAMKAPRMAPPTAIQSRSETWPPGARGGFIAAPD